MTTQNLPWIKDGLIPVAAADDLKRIYAVQTEVRTSHPGEDIETGVSCYERADLSGSDSQTAWYRVLWVFALQQMNEAGLIKFPWIHDGKPDEAVFKALATIPMTGMSPELTLKAIPFDVEELCRLVQKESEI